MELYHWPCSICTNVTYRQVYFPYSDISKLIRTGEKVIMVYFKVFTNHSPTVMERNQKFSVSIACITVKIQTRHLVNTYQNCYHLSQLASIDIRGLYFFLFKHLSIFPAVETKTTGSLFLHKYFIPLGPLSSRWQNNVFRSTLPVG